MKKIQKAGVKVIVSGSRTLGEVPEGATADMVKKAEEQKAAVIKALDWLRSRIPLQAVLHGACPIGIDSVVDRWSRDKNIRVILFPADWNGEGKAAGPNRNRRMAVQGDFLVAFWDGASKGTKSMIDEARKEGIPTYIQYLK